jgi:hypothetical protein
MTMLNDQSSHMAQRHPGGMARAPGNGRDHLMFDETIQRSLVEQRMADRQDAARADRLGRDVTAARSGSPVRIRIGRTLIGLGQTIAGSLDESAHSQRSAHPNRRAQSKRPA